MEPYNCQKNVIMSNSLTLVNIRVHKNKHILSECYAFRFFLRFIEDSFINRLSRQELCPGQLFLLLSDQINESPLEKYAEGVCKKFGAVRKKEATSA